MEFIRKFYAATPGGGGGNSPNDELEQLKESVAILKDSFISLGQLIKREITDNISQANRETRDYGRSVAAELNNTLKTMGKRSEDVVANFAALKEGTLKVDTVLEQINKTLQKQATAEIDIRNARQNGVISLSRARALTAEIQQKTKEQVGLLAQQAIEAHRIEEALGSTGQFFKSLATVPIVGKLVDAEKVLKRMQQAAADGAGKWKTFGVGIKETFASIGEKLTDPLFLVTGLVTGFIKLVKIAAEYQSKQFEAAKDLGVSVERGKELRENFINIARTNLNLALTADQLQKSYAGVQNEVGIIVKQSAEFNATSALIERRTGASAANIATLQFAAKGAGKALKDAYASIVGSAKAESARAGVVMSEKQILEGISTISGTIYQNFNGNYKAIAAANVQAKALGTTLDKINATQDQFLDFESSIAKEFEAEVLTGKELNLTRARQLALNHDTQGLMLEINKLVGSSAEWNKMDTITQQSKAEALGMSRDAVNQMYMDQQKATLLGKDAAADLQTQYDLLIKQGKTREEIANVLGQEATQSAYTASVSEKMAATMDSIKQSIAQAASILLPMAEKFTTFLADANHLKVVFTSIAAILGAAAGYSIAMKTAGMAQAATQLAVLQTLVAQNVVLQRAAVTQGLITQEQIVGAGAAATAGSAYLGPGALAIGLGVIAALGAYIGMSAMGGGGGGSTYVPPPVELKATPSPATPTTANTMAAPAATAAPTTGMYVVNQVVAAPAATTAPTTAPTTPPSTQPQVINVVIDNEVVGKAAIKSIPNIPGKN